jgi:hypothetical protein
MTRVSRIVDVSFGIPRFWRLLFRFRFGINRVVTGDKYVVIDLSFRLGSVHFTAYVDSAPTPLAEDDAPFSVTGVTMAAVDAEG